MPFALQLRHDTVFIFLAALNANIVLCDALQHIDTLAYINDAVIKQYAVDACMVIFWAVSLAPEIRSHIIFVTISQVLTSV